MRGSADTFPLRRDMTAVSKSAFINSLTMNSFFNFHYALKDRKKNSLTKSTESLMQEWGLNSKSELLHRAGYSEENPLVKVSQAHRPAGERPPVGALSYLKSLSATVTISLSRVLPIRLSLF